MEHHDAWALSTPATVAGNLDGVLVDEASVKFA